MLKSKQGENQQEFLPEDLQIIFPQIGTKLPDQYGSSHQDSEASHGGTYTQPLSKATSGGDNTTIGKHVRLSMPSGEAI